MPTAKFIGARPRRRLGVWQLDEVWTGHCDSGKCYIFDNGEMHGQNRYHIPAEHFWGRPRAACGCPCVHCHADDHPTSCRCRGATR